MEGESGVDFPSLDKRSGPLMWELVVEIARKRVADVRSLSFRTRPFSFADPAARTAAGLFRNPANGPACRPVGQSNCANSEPQLVCSEL